MKKRDAFRAWGRILQGRAPFLSIEITKECPLRCPGCYAYSPDHLGSTVTLRQLADYRGQDLVRAYVESRGGTADRPDARWREFTRLLASPRLPGGLRTTP